MVNYCRVGICKFFNIYLRQLDIYVDGSVLWRCQIVSGDRSKVD